MTDYTGANLKLQRLMCGLSIEQACKIFDVSARSWRFWESPDYQKPIPADIQEWFDTRIANIAEFLDSIEESISEFEIAAGDTDNIAGLTLFRNPRALEFAHPDFPGGLNAHNFLIALKAYIVLLNGYDVQGFYDDDARAHVEYEDIE